jgi:hypothetical protein
MFQRTDTREVFSAPLSAAVGRFIRRSTRLAATKGEVNRPGGPVLEKLCTDAVAMEKLLRNAE